MSAVGFSVVDGPSIVNTSGAVTSSVLDGTTFAAPIVPAALTWPSDHSIRHSSKVAVAEKEAPAEVVSIGI